MANSYIMLAPRLKAMGGVQRGNLPLSKHSAPQNGWSAPPMANRKGIKVIIITLPWRN